MPPFFSILVPVYNHARYVGAALDSLLAQTDADWEACVVNDGSTDETPAIIDEYARRDPRIRAFHQPNGGQPVALNAALRAARGEWVCWLSSDDLFLPDKLAAHRLWMGKRMDVRFFYTDFEMLDDATGERRPGYVSHDPLPGRAVLDLLRRNYINGISICVHRSLFDEVGGFDEKNRYGQDYDFFLRAAAESAPLRIPVVTCVQRVHAAQYTRTDTAAMFYDCAAAAVRFCNRTGFEGLFPSVDLDEPGTAAEALETALDVALSQQAFVNKLGPHPAMMLRIVEWISGGRERMRRKLLPVLLWRLRSAASSGTGTAWGSLWRAVAVWAHTLPRELGREPVNVGDVAVAFYLDLAARGEAEASDVKAYIERRLGCAAPPPPVVRSRLRDVLTDGRLDDATAQAWNGAGWRVTRLDPCADGLRLRSWGWVVGRRSARLPIGWVLCGVPPWDAAVGNGLTYRVASDARPMQCDASAEVRAEPASNAVVALRACGDMALRCAVRWIGCGAGSLARSVRRPLTGGRGHEHHASRQA